MIILGLDPGLARTGFGIINTTTSSTFMRCGVLTTPQEMEMEDRLLLLGQDLDELLNQQHIDVAVVEQLFFGKNEKTAVMVSQARGVLLYVLRQHGIPINGLTPLQIKSRLTGYGAASKEQVQRCVTQQLHLTEVPQPDDAADALAAALSLQI